MVDVCSLVILLWSDLTIVVRYACSVSSSVVDECLCNFECIVTSYYNILNLIVDSLRSSECNLIVSICVFTPVAV